jgi:hypothetical protein
MPIFIRGGCSFHYYRLRPEVGIVAFKALGKDIFEKIPNLFRTGER